MSRYYAKFLTHIIYLHSYNHFKDEIFREQRVENDGMCTLSKQQGWDCHLGQMV